MVKTIIIGLGNPILTDDSVGIKVARILKERLGGSGIDIKEVYAGGIRLMDELIGYERAVIVDAMVTGKTTPGTIRQMSLSDAMTTKNIVSTHDTNLATAVEMGRMLGLQVPSEVLIWGIEAKDVETFGEKLTTEVARAVPEAVARIINDLSNNLPVRGRL